MSCLNCFASAQTVKDNITQSTNLTHLSEKEKNWYQKFQNGLPFFDGWKQISQNILNKLPVADQHEAKDSLKILGRKIGMEWCKDNTVRKIDTDMLRRWGKMMESAIEKEKKHLVETINIIEKEVDDILFNKLASKKS